MGRIQLLVRYAHYAKLLDGDPLGCIDQYEFWNKGEDQTYHNGQVPETFSSQGSIHSG